PVLRAHVIDFPLEQLGSPVAERPLAVEQQKLVHRQAVFAARVEVILSGHEGIVTYDVRIASIHVRTLTFSYLPGSVNRKRDSHSPCPWAAATRRHVMEMPQCHLESSCTAARWRRWPPRSQSPPCPHRHVPLSSRWKYRTHVSAMPRHGPNVSPSVVSGPPPSSVRRGSRRPASNAAANSARLASTGAASGARTRSIGGANAAPARSNVGETAPLPRPHARATGTRLARWIAGANELPDK